MNAVFIASTSVSLLQLIVNQNNIIYAYVRLQVNPCKKMGAKLTNHVNFPQVK